MTSTAIGEYKVVKFIQGPTYLTATQDKKGFHYDQGGWAHHNSTGLPDHPRPPDLKEKTAGLALNIAFSGAYKKGVVKLFKLL